jgi:hypothetical protein
VAGMEAGLQTILVLTGITTREEARRFPFLPSRIVDSVADLVDDIGDEPRPAGWPPSHRRIGTERAATGPSRERLLSDPATTCAIARHERRRLGGFRWSRRGPEGDPLVDPRARSQA